MKGATSIHIEPCKVNTSEAHNLRLKELTYVNKDFKEQNEHYIVPGGEDLPRRLSDMRTQYENKFKKKMQKKASPIREGVIVLSPTSTMNEIKAFARQIESIYGIKTLQIHIHNDEGHTDKETGEWVQNRHAHIVFDYFNHDTCLTFRPNRQDMCKMQDTLAECLHMTRGESSDVEHLNAIQYKSQQAEQELAKLMQNVRNNLNAINALIKTKDQLKQAIEIAHKNGITNAETLFKVAPVQFKPEAKQAI